MDGWQVPGIAVGIVDQSKPVWRDYLGVINVQTRTPVDNRTLFAIGSITKSMTALSFAITHISKDLSLDRQVKSVLPYFPSGVTVRHLLSHRTGWPRHDALWYLNAYDRRTLPRKLAHLPRFAKAGNTFQYNNVPFAVAGEFLSNYSGQSWDRWVRATVLNPLGMGSSLTRFEEFRNNERRASPYFPAPEGRITLPLRDTDPVAPAAGIYAPLPDMMRYLTALASDGILNERRIFAAAAVQELRRPTYGRYGLGLRLGNWRGEELAFHPGFIDGYGARLSILPGRSAGVVVLTNMSGETPVAQIVSQSALDCLTGTPRTDWVARFGHRRKPAKPAPPAPDPVAMDKPAILYTGTFEHPAYGALSFSDIGKASLAGKFHGREFELVYAGDDRWRLTETHWPLREGLLFSFADFRNGHFFTLKTPLADGPTYRHNAGPLTFRRKALP